MKSRSFRQKYTSREATQCMKNTMWEVGDEREWAGPDRRRKLCKPTKET